MAIQSKAQLMGKLTESAKRVKQVREAAERERVSTQLQESESPRTAQTPLQTRSPLQGKP